MLDLRYNHTSKVYEAPFQLKSNNGIYLIDDFGRQRATPAEVLNRWIVPMERRVDYLNFMTGGKMTVPFESFLVFSTNLNPADLGDEAFLRRIQYKMLLRGPSEQEFLRIFENFCAAKRITYPHEVVHRFLEKRYKRGGKVKRRCHPRDVLSHALNMIFFEKLPYEITDEILDRAFESCFVNESPDEVPVESPLLPVMAESCADFWTRRISELGNAFGGVMFVAGLRDRTDGSYRDDQSVRRFGEAETARVLHKLHTRVFRDWLTFDLDQRMRDVSSYVSATADGVSRLDSVVRESMDLLVPADVKDEEARLFAHDMGMILQRLRPQAA